MSRKKYLRAIYESGKALEFVEYLLKRRSYVVEDYAKIYCNKRHIKPVSAEQEKDILETNIRLAHVSWLDKD